MTDHETDGTAPGQTGGRRPSELVLHHLVQAGNLDRLESEAKRFLAEDPEDTSAHYYLTLALIDLERLLEAKLHLGHLLSNEPESVITHIAAVAYYDAAGDGSKVRHHIDEGLRLAPDLAYFHRHAAISSLHRLKLKEARRHIARARELDPDDGDIANLYIRIHGAEETSAEDALRRLDDYRAALRLDPENAALHDSMGDVCLDELDDPVEAEKHYREALRIEPGNRAYQRDLFQAVAKRSLVYRLFSLPSRTFTWLGHVARGIAIQPWRILFLLIGIKVVGVFLLWLLLATVLFWPGGKVYEWLLVSEIKRGAGTSNAELRAWHWFRRWPAWGRFALFLGVNLLLWGALFTATGAPLVEGYAFVAFVVGLHFVFVCVAWSLRKHHASSARRKAERRKSPPPLPARR